MIKAFMAQATAFALACGLLFSSVPGHAQVAAPGVKYIANERAFGTPVSTCCATPYTNATTSYTAVTGLTTGAAATVYDPSQLISYNGQYQFDHLWIWWSVNIKKATSLGGTCELALNGNALANSATAFTPAAWPETGVIGGFYDAFYAQDTTAFNTGAGGQTQTVTVQCKSADTAVLTVSNGSLSVKERF